ncbi:hypothetical protein E2C01_062600 [Portunus trituberculatus]|uniref:Uncharacterized protein n=1 Tax=Portunus trituberculatus TaxID=210409 RepID=A0A5B7H8B8_PORTR|nr:hypothetical protein [Portunus trituberculatus]
MYKMRHWNVAETRAPASGKALHGGAKAGGAALRHANTEPRRPLCGVAAAPLRRCGAAVRRRGAALEVNLKKEASGQHW